MKVIVIALTTVAVSSIGGYAGRNVPMVEQIDVYEHLGQVSAIIFGLMGAWIAIIHPGALANILSRPTETESERSAINRLVFPMLTSTAVVTLALVVVSVLPIVKRVELTSASVTIGRGVSYGLISLMTISLMWGMVATMAPLDRIKSEADGIAAREETKARRHSQNLYRNRQG